MGTSDARPKTLVTFDAPAFIKSTRTKATKEAPTMNETRYLGLGIGRKSFGAQIAAKMAGRDSSDMFEGGSHYGTKALTSSAGPGRDRRPDATRRHPPGPGRPSPSPTSCR